MLAVLGGTEEGMNKKDFLCASVVKIYIWRKKFVCI